MQTQSQITKQKQEIKNQINLIRQNLLINTLDDVNKNAKKSNTKINSKTIKEFISKYDDKNFVKEKENIYFCNDSNNKGVMEINYNTKNPKKFTNFHKEENDINLNIYTTMNFNFKENKTSSASASEKPFLFDKSNSNSSLISNFSTLTSTNSKISVMENDEDSFDFLWKLVKSIKKD
jgi:hypothetical protein